jgi:hypothetical protein
MHNQHRKDLPCSHFLEMRNAQQQQLLLRIARDTSATVRTDVSRHHTLGSHRLQHYANITFKRLS